MADTSKITLKQLKDAMNKAKNYTDNEIAGVTGVSTVEPEALDMPKVFFNGDKPRDKTAVHATIEYISKTQHFKGYVDIKCQGTSSMAYPKKNYTIKMFSDETRSTKLKKDFKGWGKQSKFCLKANYIDHSHARNIVSAKLWGQVVKSRSDFDSLPEELKTSPNYGAVDGFPIKVYYNGTYEGVYTWNIPKDGWMNNMDDKLDTHCILCGEEYVSGCFRRADATLWSDELHDTMPASIVTSFNNFQNFVINSSDDEFKTGLSTYADVNSLIDYYIFQYVICGLDSMGKNQLFFTYDGTKWIASSYDMDSTFGLYWNGQNFVSATYRMQEDYESMANDRPGNVLYIRMEELFYTEIKARYAELRAGVLSYANIVNEFERFMDVIGKDLYAEDLTIYTAIPSGNTNNIQQIRNYTRDRLAYVDTQIEALRELIPCTNINLNKTELALGNILSEPINKNYLDGIVPRAGETDILFDNIILSAGDYVFTNINGGTFTWLNYSIDGTSFDLNTTTTDPAAITISTQSASVTVHAFPGDNPANNTPDKLALYKIVPGEVQDAQTYTFEQAGTGYYTENGDITSDANNVYSNTLTLDSNKTYVLKYIGASQADSTNLVIKTSSGVVYVRKMNNTNDMIKILNNINSLTISVNTVEKPMSLSDLVLVECSTLYEKTSTINQGRLIATVEPSDTTDTVVWSVNSTGIVTVEDGLVTAISNGEAVITATCGTQTATCNVTVTGLAVETLSYELAEAKTFNGSSDFVDTGIPLLNSRNKYKDWTMLIEFSQSVFSESSIIHCMTESTGYPGIYLASTSTGAIRTVLPNNVIRNIVISTTIGERVKLVFKKVGNVFIVYDRYMTEVAANTVNTIVETDKNLLLGAYQTTDGTKGRFMTGTIYKFKIIEGNMSDDDCLAWMGVQSDSTVITSESTPLFKVNSACLNTETNTLTDSVAGISAELSGAPTVGDNQMIFTANDTFNFDVSSLGLASKNITFKIKFTPTIIDNNFRNVFLLGSDTSFANSYNCYVHDNTTRIQFGSIEGGTTPNNISNPTISNWDSGGNNFNVSALTVNTECEIIISIKNSTHDLRIFKDGELVQNGRLETIRNILRLGNVEGTSRFIGKYSLIELYHGFMDSYISLP